MLAGRCFGLGMLQPVSWVSRHGGCRAGAKDFLLQLVSTLRFLPRLQEFLRGEGVSFPIHVSLGSVLSGAEGAEELEVEILIGGFQRKSSRR